MVIKANLAWHKELPFDVQTLNGDELRSLSTHADSEYLVIDLGNVKGRQAGFNETMKVAMSAAVNAVLASMGGAESVAKKSKAVGIPKTIKSADQAEDKSKKQARQSVMLYVVSCLMPGSWRRPCG